MAKVTSGSFNTTKYGDRYLVFSWSATQDISKNQSTISWTLKGAGGTTTSYYMSAPFSVTIAGEEVYKSTTRIQLKNGTTVASGTKVITHNSNGTKSFSASVKAAIYSYSNNVSGSGTWELKDIPRGATITSAPNFNDEENPTIKYTNPLGNSVDNIYAYISFDKSGAQIPLRGISKTGTSYTFNFTDAERETLRNYCSDAISKTVYFYIRTVINGVNYHSSVAKTLTIVNAIPTFGTTIVDAGAASTALTGNNSNMIKGFNYISASIIATPSKGATITSYKITNGGKVINASSGVFENTKDNKFVCTVTDSRGSSRTKTVTLTMIDYVTLSCNADIKISIDESNSTKAILKFNVTGNCFNGSFGAANNPLALTLHIEQVGGTAKVHSVDVPASAFDGNTYSYTYSVTGLPYQSSWRTYVTVQDAISEFSTLPKTLKALPIFDWSEEDFNFNVPVAYKGTKLFYEAGDVVEFDKNELIMAGMISNGGKDLYFTIPLSKPVMTAGVTVSGNIVGRAINGYISGGEVLDVLLSPDTSTQGHNDAGVWVKMAFPEAIVSNANNTPVAVASYGLKIEFS